MMAHGGYRPGAGRREGAKGAKAIASGEAVMKAHASGMTPLEYMLAVMRDVNEDPARRDRMAVAAAPFVHSRAAESAPSKKDDVQARAERIAHGGGRFSLRSEPRLVAKQ